MDSQSSMKSHRVTCIVPSGFSLPAAWARTHRGEGEGGRAGEMRDDHGGPTCDEILLAISLQRHPTHGGGGGRVDGIDVPVGTLEHLWEKTGRNVRSVLVSTAP